MKAGILALLGFGSRFGGVNFAIGLLLAVSFSRFGMAVLVTSMLSVLVLCTGWSSSWKLDGTGLTRYS